MPAPVVNLSRDFYPYISDDLNTYVVATLDANAAAQTSPPAAIDPSTHIAYPRGFVMRHLYGEAVISGVTYRTKVPILDPTDVLWTGPSAPTIVKFGTTYNIYGRIGERRIYRS